MLFLLCLCYSFYMTILRKCAGCGQMKPREDMIKITKVHQADEVIVNPDSKTFGRSAYLCYNQNCVEQALKKNKLNKVLKTIQCLISTLGG